ncbi:metallophosphoesterase family protein [Anaerocolumna xylanovorans]|uniref:DNA repair exonuclease SbcCD nuclease subunit n=1 Tax=Anaerocolumna xylanovorans DSM 12503 TaxID=1121345 RepID=A0A1M7Y6E4_9FIRM|nr:exonuclease SbcCD subunit D [Anaerocolumna xylanovorans]SHO48174.1 DNA repair exonuclease SbcCD nuclease subunit [Anaerocolumna xylanovorans DSM 12503]
MKFIHIADVHLGASPDRGFPWSEQRAKDIWDGFFHITEICEREEIDLLLIAGDLFHKQPLLRELKEVSYALGRLSKTQVVLIAGNHDYISERSPYTGFSWTENVHMLINRDMDSIYLENINTEVYGFSYHAREIKEPLYDKITPGCAERINILLAHGGTADNIPIDKNALLRSDFDYIALGHIHKPEYLAERIAYCGSLEPMDKNETGERGFIKGVIIKEEEKNTIHSEFISQAKCQYKKTALTIHPGMTNGEIRDGIKAVIKSQGEGHIYQFCLMGKRARDMIFDRESFLTLGNILEVTDNTLPDYDFKALKEENEDNIIGLYIKAIEEGDFPKEFGEKALYYGMEALLEAKNYK